MNRLLTVRLMLPVNKVLWAALLALGLSASLSSAADLMDGSPGRLSAEEAKPSLVPITTEAAMRNEKGEPIYDCLEPHISKFGDTWYAYGFTIREKDVFAATCYSSTDLKTWIFRAKYPVEKRGIPLWNVLYNAKNKEYVGYGAEYGDKIHVYTSPSPIGPFTYKKPMSAVHGGPGDLLMYPDTDGTAYLIYNKYQGEIPQRFAYIYQLNDDYYDIVPSTLCNTNKVMEGFWMIKRNGTYFLLGSGLVSYDVDDNFYLTAPSPLGPWTDKGYIAPVGTKTFKSQTFQGLEVTGPKGTAYVFIGHRWKTQVGGLWANATSIWLPLKFTKDHLIEEMKWYENWLLDTEGATLVPPPPLSPESPQASSTVNGESAPTNVIDNDPATGWSSPGTGTVTSREPNVISRFQAKGNETLSGFYARLSHCVGPVDAPTIVGLRVNGALRQECVTLPVYRAPLNEYTRQNGRVFPPLDVAQEYRIALAAPLALNAGDKLNLEIISSGAMSGGVTAGLQFEGSWNLAEMREPFRQTKATGPVSRIA
ncbi:MAG: family 43 glycosylhydrolase, partial [Verrucomicrobiota bacterium]